MTYAVRNNRLLAARMGARCDGTVKMYRQKAWEIALREARSRSFLSSVLFSLTQWAALQSGREDLE